MSIGHYRSFRWLWILTVPDQTCFGGVACRRLNSQSKDHHFESRCGKKAVSFAANRSKWTGMLVLKLDSEPSDHILKDQAVFSHSRKMKKPVIMNVAKEGAGASVALSAPLTLLPESFSSISTISV